MNIQGYYDPRFEAVAKEFRALWQDIEIGAALHITLDGERMVDLWGGFQDPNNLKTWRRETLVNVYSTTKGILALAVAQLVDRGLLDYNRPVSHYWPEFGAEQKFDITLEQLVSHQAGLIDCRPAIKVTDLYNWQKITTKLSAQRPLWRPGTAFGYHAITWGYLVGEVIRRVTGESPGGYLRQQVSGPLKADVFVGLEKSDLIRCATLIGPNRARKPLATKELTNPAGLKSSDPVITPYKDACSEAFRRAEIPATNGHASAKGLARCYAAALDGSVFNAEILTVSTTELTQGQEDLVLGKPIRRARGFILNCDACYFGPSHRAFGHSGTGGSIAFADPENGVGFAYVMNQLHVDGSVRSRRLIDSFYECL